MEVPWHYHGIIVGRALQELTPDTLHYCHRRIYFLAGHSITFAQQENLALYMSLEQVNAGIILETSRTIAGCGGALILNATTNARVVERTQPFA